MVKNVTTRAAAMERIIATLRRGRTFLVTAHPAPDGDAIGSMAAALLVLEQLRKEVVAYNPDPVPERFRFLDCTQRFVRELPAGPFDVTLVLDTSDDRMMPVGYDRGALGTIAVVDHHKTFGGLGDLVWQDPDAAAVGVLIYRLIDQMGLELTVPVAEALYCSLISDTGSFRYQNTNPEAMRAAAALLEVGIDPWRVSSGIYEERPHNQVALLGRVLNTLELSGDGLTAALTVTTQMLQETGCSTDMVDGFINYARGIKGVEVAVLLRPNQGGTRASFRSRGTVDVSRIAESHGGGGHHNAAGCWIPGTSGDALRALFEEVSRQVNRGER